MYQNLITLQYPNGDRYIGQVCNTQTGATPHGQGTMYYQNGQIYIGAFYVSIRHGHGKLTYPNGDSYFGNFSNGQFHGAGESFRQRDNRRYVGNHVAGFEEGWGTIMGTATVQMGGKKRYEGYMVKGRREGQGTQWVTSLDGSVATFQGEWRNDLLHGPGTLTSANRIISGVFQYGKLEGECTIVDTVTGIPQVAWYRGGDPVLY
jgi:hypothetical protein